MLVIMIVPASAHPFEDIPEKAWYEPAVEALYETKIITGMKDDIFAPNSKVSRADFAVMLYRLAAVYEIDEVNSEKEIYFSDIEKDSYYYEAVLWAVESETITGFSGDGTEEKPYVIKPQTSLTRETMATLIHRFIAEAGVKIERMDDQIYVVEDKGAVSNWSEGSIIYCIERGIMNGYKKFYGWVGGDLIDGVWADWGGYRVVFSPQGLVTRAEAAQTFYNLMKLTGHI